MKKLQLLIGGILLTGIVCMTACAGTKKEETVSSGDTPSSEISQYDEVKQSTWKEKWQEETASGVAVNVDVHARVSVPSVTQMSVVEVRKYPFSKENREKLTEAVFDEKTTVKTKKIEGQKDGICYDLYFETLKAGERQEYIRFEPKKIQDVAPDIMNDRDFISCYGITKANDSGDKNECKLTESEAGKIAQEFVDKTGFSDWVLLGGQELVWDASYDSRLDENEDISRYKDGYEFEYALGTDGVGFYKFGVKLVGYTRMTKVDGKEVEETFENDEYSRTCYLTIDVTDKGVIQAEWYNPVEIVSATSGVKLLPFNQIKDIVKSEMGEYARYYYNKNSLHLKFDRMDLIYYRMDNPDEKDCFTYIPVWRLGDEDSQTIFMVNAMDGTIIKDWDDEWNFGDTIW